MAKITKAGRPYLRGVERDTSGRSRGEPPEVARAVVMAQRIREVGPHWANNELAGFTLGLLHLRHRADKSDPSGITANQLHAGNEWAGICYRHARIMGYEQKRLRAWSPLVVRGIDCLPDPTDEDIADIRDRYRVCYDAIMELCRNHVDDKRGCKGGLRIRDVLYGVCVENWPVRMLGHDDYGHLRVGLNALGRALKTCNNS